jgi:hypothetical protein
LKRLGLILILITTNARAGDAAFVFVGEPDPSGADEAFLKLGVARGAPVAREQPGSVAEDPRARLQKAIEAYARLQLPDARARLDALEAEVAASGGAGLDRGELVELFATRAAVRSAAGDEGATWDDLLQVAAFAPSRPLDPARFPPRLVETERRAAESLSTSGKLMVSASDASIFVDGLDVGRGQIEVVVPAGRHFVRAARAGFSPSGRTVEVSAQGASLTIPLSARAAPPIDLFVQRAQMAGSRRVLGAYIGARNGGAVLELLLAEVATGVVRGRVTLDVGARLSESALESAVDALLPPPPTEHPRAPWYKRPLVWGIVGGVVAATALSVGLGVGLGGDHVAGFSIRVDLKGAR